MADLELISAAKRKSLRPSQFADPENQAYPIDTAERTRNAPARLEQNKGSMSVEKYHRIRARIARAARRFGIDSEYNKPETATSTRGLRMTTTHPDGTKVEISHMSAAFYDDADGGSLRLAMPINKAAALADGDADKRVWVQVARSGRWLGHRQGPFELNAKVFDQICANFVGQKVGRIQYDFEHASEMPPSEGEIPTKGTPAQGWIYALKHDGRNLYALTEWKPLARDYIANDQYQGVSPAIRWNQKDRETGKPIGAILSSVALTNSPFLTQMNQPTAASTGTDVSATFCSLTEEEPPHLTLAGSRSCCYSDDEYMPRIRSALRMHELATPGEVSEKIGALRQYMVAAGGDHTKMVNGVQLADFTKPIRDIVNPHAGMSWDEVFDIIEDIVDVAMDRHIIQDHGGVEESTPPSLNSSAEATAPAASNLNSTGGPAMAKTIEQLELEVTNLSGERSTLLSQIEALTSERDTLKAKVDEHEAQVLSARVDEAFSTYKDKYQLPPNAKGTMLSLLKVDASGFEQMYPRLEPKNRHLLSVLTGDARNGNASQPRVAADLPSDNGNVRNLSARELTSKLMRENPGMTLATAQIKVDEMMTKLRRQQGHVL